MDIITSYIASTWSTQHTDSLIDLYNPTTEAIVAQAAPLVIDPQIALDHATQEAGILLKEMSFSERADLLQSMASLIHKHRDELIELAIINGGNTRSDAKFDIDGASATLAAYAHLGKSLGDSTWLIDGEGIQLGRSPRFHGQHIYTPLRGVAVHINAFNFPAWGMFEKAAVALLSGTPVITKPATTTALVAHRIVQLIIEQNILPQGALSLVIGDIRPFLKVLTAQDTVAFTGSSNTAATLRVHPTLIQNSVRLNIEADSLNASVLCEDVDEDSETFSLFLQDVVRDITQKTGQKCTATRRIFVPQDKLDIVCDALAERLSEIPTSDPAQKGNMGPLVSKDQYTNVKEGIALLANQTDEIFGGLGETNMSQGYFVSPVLRKSNDALKATTMHELEIFGPVATIAALKKSEDIEHVLAKGKGSLVSSIYSEDRTLLQTLIPRLATYNGRIYIGNAKIAGHAPGPGTVLPLLTHGGPGRAGGGEELGGLRGLSFYHQRTALSGDKSSVNTIIENIAAI